MPTERIEYAPLTSSERHVRESFVDTDDLPTNNGRGKCFFRSPDLPDHPIECDISPDARFVQEGDVKKLVSGHILLLCPKCAARNGRMSPLHIMADNKTAYVREAAYHYVPKSNPQLNFFLSILTVLEPISCDYREPSVGSCDWRAKIAEGIAYEVGGAGQIFIGKK